MRSVQKRLLVGLANSRPEERWNAREIVVHFDGRGAVRCVTGPIVNAAGWIEARGHGADEAKAILVELGALAQLGLVSIKRELHENGRTARVKAYLTRAGLKRRHELREEDDG